MIIKTETPTETSIRHDQIPLGNGRFAIIDPELYEILNRYHWKAKRSGRCWYVVTKMMIGGKYKWIRMHRFITNCPNGWVVHHINHNTFDNRRDNLYVCTTWAHNLLKFKELNIGTQKSGTFCSLIR